MRPGSSSQPAESTMHSAPRWSDARRRACRVAFGMLLCTMEPPAEALKAARAGESESRIRLDAGDLDPTFGDRGKVVVSFTPGFGAAAFFIQDDGAFILGGSSGSDFAVTRRHADGRL